MGPLKLGMSLSYFLSVTSLPFLSRYVYVSMISVPVRLRSSMRVPGGSSPLHSIEWRFLPVPKSIRGERKPTSDGNPSPKIWISSVFPPAPQPGIVLVLPSSVSRCKE